MWRRSSCLSQRRFIKMGKYDVKRAVIPCAGKGTRFLPITKGVAKEMCPIVDRPTLDYIVQECVDGGVTDIVFIVSRDKDDIKKFYTRDEEGEQIALDYQNRYEQALFKMVRDYHNQVPWYFRDERGGFIDFSYNREFDGPCDLVPRGMVLRGEDTKIL